MHALLRKVKWESKTNKERLSIISLRGVISDTWMSTDLSRGTG
jgi:hypothetical protein